MSLSKQLIEDLSKIDLVEYAIDKCQELGKLQNYRDYLNNKIINLQESENREIRELLDAINENVCKKGFCQSLQDSYEYLIERIKEFENRERIQLLLEKSSDKVIEIIMTEFFIEEFVYLIYNIAWLKNNPNLDLLANLYYNEIDTQVRAYLRNYFAKKII